MDLDPVILCPTNVFLGAQYKAKVPKKYPKRDFPVMKFKFLKMMKSKIMAKNKEQKVAKKRCRPKSRKKGIAAK